MARRLSAVNLLLPPAFENSAWPVARRIPSMENDLQTHLDRSNWPWGGAPIDRGRCVAGSAGEVRSQ